MSTELALPAGCELSPVGLRIVDPALDYAEYVRLCVLLGRAHAALRWAIGDAIRYGEALYGEEAYQAIAEMGLSEEVLREYVRVAERVPPSRRRAELSWSHHRAVAALPPAEQTAWLERAISEGLSHHELRHALRARTLEEARGDASVASMVSLLSDDATVPSRCPWCGRAL